MSLEAITSAQCSVECLGMLSDAFGAARAAALHMPAVRRSAWRQDEQRWRKAERKRREENYVVEEADAPVLSAPSRARGPAR
jgi:hypothetical protein